MAHLHEKIDFTTSVYIVRDDQVLLHKHKKLGIWLPPGGHIELFDRKIIDENTLGLKDAVRSYALAAIDYFIVK